MLELLGVILRIPGGQNMSRVTGEVTGTDSGSGGEGAGKPHSIFKQQCASALCKQGKFYH